MNTVKSSQERKVLAKKKIPSLTVAKESRAHKRRNYAIYELLFSF